MNKPKYNVGDVVWMIDFDGLYGEENEIVEIKLLRHRDMGFTHTYDIGAIPELGLKDRWIEEGAFFPTFEEAKKALERK